jgi:hypothetical protein
VHVLTQMTMLLGNRKASLIWLRAPHPELGGHSPLELLYSLRRPRLRPRRLFLRHASINRPQFCTSPLKRSTYTRW